MRSACRRAAHRQAGLTLVELLVVLVIASVLLGWAAPATSR
ncbi:prepilin-type N-terminal cleavage/methylation domain-containing protein [Halomonas sp. E19]